MVFTALKKQALSTKNNAVKYKKDLHFINARDAECQSAKGQVTPL